MPIKIKCAENFHLMRIKIQAIFLKSEGFNLSR